MNYQGVRKTFDPGLHLKNDDIAKQNGINLMNAIFRVNAIENPDTYGVDLLLMSDSGQNLGAAEVEVKYSWKDHFFFKTLHIPERKEKFAKQGVYFIVFNQFLNKALLVEGQTLLNSPKKPVKNKFVKDGEFFFDVPIEECFYYDISSIKLCG